MESDHNTNGDQELAPKPRSEWTWEKLINPKQRELLECYRRVGTMKAAFAETGIDKNTHYKWMDEDGLYAEAYNNSRIRRNPILEETAYERALGVEVPVLNSRGIQIGTKLEYDNKLLWNLLVNNHPAYAKSLQSNQQNVQVNADRPRIQVVLPDNGRD